MTVKRRTFSPEFKREAASLVLSKDYTYSQACEALGIEETALRERAPLGLVCDLFDIKRSSYMLIVGASK